MTAIQSITPTIARRLAVSAQRLAGPQPSSDIGGLREVIGSLNCLQLDPISAVAQSHLLVLWSRMSSYDRPIWTGYCGKSAVCLSIGPTPPRMC